MKPQNLLVSVVIPTWNRGSLLIRAVESALAQTHSNIEILVCDDGSDDGSIEQVQMTFSDQIAAEKVRILKAGRTGGPAGPRNRGIKNARGQWLAFLDSDDTWVPEKIEAQLDFAIAAGLKAVCSNAFRVDVKNEVLGHFFECSTSRVLTWQDLWRTNLVICSSMMLNAELKALSAGFPEDPSFKAIEDYALWVAVSAEVPIGYFDKPIVFYRDAPAESIRRDDQLSGDQVREKAIQHMIGLSPWPVSWVWKLRRCILGLKNGNFCRLV